MRLTARKSARWTIWRRLSRKPGSFRHQHDRRRAAARARSETGGGGARADQNALQRCLGAKSRRTTTAETAVATNAIMRMRTHCFDFAHPALRCRSRPSSRAKKAARRPSGCRQRPGVVKPKELSLVRVNVTGQPYDYFRPWQKKAPFSKRALGAVLPHGRVLVTADLVANQNYVELERAEIRRENRRQCRRGRLRSEPRACSSRPIRNSSTASAARARARHRGGRSPLPPGNWNRPARWS